MDDRMERLLEAAREVEIDARERSDAYNIYQFVGIKHAVAMLAPFFEEMGIDAPTLEDLEDEDFLAKFIEDNS